MYLQIPLRRPLWSLPINPHSVMKLREAGYEYLEDLLVGQSTRELKELLSKIEVKLDLSTFIYEPVVKTSLELFKVEKTGNGHVVTFSRAVDDLLGGGIPSSRLTELVGAPGTGKTQICFQLCVSIQIPKFLGYLSGSAVYVGTNNNFSEKRINEIHAAVIEHCLATTKDATVSEEDNSALRSFIKTDPLLGIQKYSIETTEELKASLYVIEKMLKQSKNIRLIIIDSFTFLTYSTEITLERTKMISEILNHLNELAIIHGLAVVVTNELTTRILDKETKEIVPSLGESFAHVMHNRILLGRQDSSKIHTAILQKSSEYPIGSAYFQITREGIRDVPIS